MPHPDLSKILPVPLLHRAPGRTSPLAFGLDAPPPDEDYLLDIEKAKATSADDPGFGLDQALHVAQRLADTFANAPKLHLPDPLRVSNLLAAPN